MKSLGNGNQLLVAKKVFGSSDSTYLVTMTADDAWNVASVEAERVYPTGGWLMIDAAPTSDGMMITGLRPGNPENGPDLFYFTDAGEVDRRIRIAGLTGIDLAYQKLFSDDTSVVAYASRGPGTGIYRVGVGQSGIAFDLVTVSIAEDPGLQILAGCAGSSPSEHVLAGSGGNDFFTSGWLGLFTPNGASWVKQYSFTGAAAIVGIVQAQDGGYTCTVSTDPSGVETICYLMHVGDTGDVEWCTPLVDPATGMRFGPLVQLSNGNYLVQSSGEMQPDRLYKFTATGDYLGYFMCSTPCDLFYLGSFHTDPAGTSYNLTDHSIVTLDDAGGSCGLGFNAGSTSSTGSPIVNSYTPVLATSPAVTTTLIPLVGRTSQIVPSVSCSIATVPEPFDLNAGMVAFPVPTDGRVALRLGTGRTSAIPVEVHDLSGRVVMRGYAPGELDMSSMEPGVYECFAKGTRMHVRIVRQ